MAVADVAVAQNLNDLPQYHHLAPPKPRNPVPPSSHAMRQVSSQIPEASTFVWTFYKSEHMSQEITGDRACDTRRPNNSGVLYSPPPSPTRNAESLTHADLTSYCNIPNRALPGWECLVVRAECMAIRSPRPGTHTTHHLLECHIRGSLRSRAYVAARQ